MRKDATSSVIQFDFMELYGNRKSILLDYYYNITGACTGIIIMEAVFLLENQKSIALASRNGY